MRDYQSLTHTTWDCKCHVVYTEEAEEGDIRSDKQAPWKGAARVGGAEGFTWNIQLQFAVGGDDCLGVGAVAVVAGCLHSLGGEVMVQFRGQHALGLCPKVI